MEPIHYPVTSMISPHARATEFDSDCWSINGAHESRLASRPQTMWRQELSEDLKASSLLDCRQTEWNKMCVWRGFTFLSLVPFSWRTSRKKWSEAFSPSLRRLSQAKSILYDALFLFRETRSVFRNALKIHAYAPWYQLQGRGDNQT